MKFDPLALLIFVVFVVMPLGRRLLGRGRREDTARRRAPARPRPDGPVAFPMGLPFPTDPPPRELPPEEEGSGEGQGLEGPADMRVEDVATEAVAVPNFGQGLGAAMDLETQRLAREAERVAQLGHGLDTELGVAPELDVLTPDQPGWTAEQTTVLPDLYARNELARAVVLAEILAPPRALRHTRPSWRR